MIEFLKSTTFTTYIFPFATFGFGWLAKVIYERYTLNYKLKTEFNFEQKKKLKEELANNKFLLLNAVEELNHRLWNFSQNLEFEKYSVPKNRWCKDEQYYLNSFLYRYLKVIYLTIKTERDTISIDPEMADKEDLLFLKYIKTFKDIFTDRDLICNLKNEKRTTHFFKNHLFDYSSIVVKENEVLGFNEFEKELKHNYDRLEKVINYFTEIKNSKNDCSLNVLKCFHLLSLNFLNKYGLDYQKTKEDKIKLITEQYKCEIAIKKEFEEFLIKSKLEGEMKNMLDLIK